MLEINYSGINVRNSKCFSSFTKLRKTEENILKLSNILTPFRLFLLLKQINLRKFYKIAGGQ